jgi:hypothetical protein
MSTVHIPTIEAKARRFASQFQYAIIAAVVMSICPLRTLAQDHDHAMTMQQELSPDQKRQQGALLQKVREATGRFKDVRQAEYEQYALTFGCVSGPDKGAMGLHYVNFALVGTGVIDPARPQIVLYEPTPGGRPKLTGADFLVDAVQWDSDPKHTGPPELMGQLFHYFEAPNRFGLKPFYTLHVWAWKDNPSGAFANWNPDVSCASYVGATNN